MISFIGWILIGFISGFIANILIGKPGCGCGRNTIVGMIGSLLGGAIYYFWTTKKFDLTSDFTHFNSESLIVSTFGAIVLLLLLKLLKDKN